MCVVCVVMQVLDGCEELANMNCPGSNVCVPCADGLTARLVADKKAEIGAYDKKQ